MAADRTVLGRGRTPAGGGGGRARTGVRGPRRPAPRAGIRQVCGGADHGRPCRGLAARFHWREAKERRVPATIATRPPRRATKRDAAAHRGNGRSRGMRGRMRADVFIRRLPGPRMAEKELYRKVPKGRLPTSRAPRFQGGQLSRPSLRQARKPSFNAWVSCVRPLKGSIDNILWTGRAIAQMLVLCRATEDADASPTRKNAIKAHISS